MATPEVMGIPDFMLGTSRSMLTMMQFNEQKQDYLDSLKDLDENSEEYQKVLLECHKRGAERAARVARMHRGLYVKAAQFVASIRGGTGDRGIPRPYIDALKEFTDAAPHQPVTAVADVLKEAMHLGDWPQGDLDEMSALSSIEVEPIASASLAQVHRARLRDGTKVCVKVQYPELRKEMASDFMVFKTMGQQIKPEGYDLMWVVEDFEKNLSRELDFLLEGKTGEETDSQLAHLRPRVFVPKVYFEHSSSRVLCMEYCEGLIKCNDPKALRAAGLDVDECAELICEVFAEMIFIHGRVHADPHAGNIYIRPYLEAGGRVRPQLVLLDHGLYYELQESDVRYHLCKYWKACCEKDSAVMDSLGQRFAGSLKRFLPLIFSPYFIFGGSGVSLHEVLAAAKGQLPDTIKLRDVADFIVATRTGGANLIGVLHSLGYTRGILEDLGFAEDKRLACMLKYAVLGETPYPPKVPPELTLEQASYVRWRIRMLSGHIRLLAPLAWPLEKFAKAETAPPLWLVLAVPVALAAVAVAVASSWFREGKSARP